MKSAIAFFLNHEEAIAKKIRIFTVTKTIIEVIAS